MLASETAGLDVLGATYVRDVDPGEIVVLGEPGGPRSLRFAAGREQLCVFELLYFARPDSVMLGRNLYEVRRRLGEALAREAPADADLVMPVPETGGPAAAGYAEASGIPYRDGMVRNRYAGRTFIQPSAALRQRGVNVKLSPLPEQVRDRRLVVVDDSIVRGTTTRQIVALLRRAGAREIHLRISAPPIYHPCFYGIDTQIETELIAARHSLEEIRAYLGADSLAYLSIGGVLGAIGLPRERFCFACFDGQYPVPVPYDVTAHKFVLEAPPVTTPAMSRPRDARPDPLRSAYASAGVDVAAGERAVELMRARVTATQGPDVLAGIGGFAAAVRLPAGLREPVLVSATDGVGTKTAIARAMRRLDTIGVDLVAMCADDVVCLGARPLCFLDYLALGHLDPVSVATLVGGVARGCALAGCALVGGETAEHPGLMAPDEFDLAGFCVGIAERRGAARPGRRGGRRCAARAGRLGAARQRVLARAGHPRPPRAVP